MIRKRILSVRGKIFLFILVYIAISAFLIFMNIKDNDLVPICVNNYSTSEVKYYDNALNMLSIIITIVSIVVTLSISLTTLLLDRTNIKLSDYLSLVAEKDGSLTLLVIILLNTILSLIIIYQPYTILLDIWLKIGIIPPIIFFIILIKNFEIIDKEDRMKEHLLSLLDNNKRDDFVGFLLKITNNSFGKEFYSILSNVMENTKITDREYLFSVNNEVLNGKNDDNIDYLLKMQNFIVPRADDPLFDKLEDDYLKYTFSKYKSKVFAYEASYNHFIMRIKNNLYDDILYNENLSIEQEKILLRKYLNLMFRSYELVIIILRKGNINNTREAINDFLGMVQFFSVNKMINRNGINFEKRHNYYLVGIVCWLLNLIIINNWGVDEYINLIKTLLKRITEIDLSGLEDDIFEDIITDITFHKIRYTRTFFIALVLVFLDESEVPEILEKVYCNNEYNNNHYLFRRIIDAYKDITPQEKRAVNFSCEKFDKKEKIICKIIGIKINSIIKEQNKTILNTPIKDEILRNEKENIEKELHFLVSDNQKSFSESSMLFISSLPRRYLTGDPSSVVLGMGIYKTSVLLFFYKTYIADCENKKISKISDIPDKDTKLIIPIHLNDYIFRHTEYSYKNDGIEIEGKYYPILWIQARGPIVTLKNLVDYINIPRNAVEIKPDREEEKNGELYTECNITIKYCKNNYPSKLIGYSIL